MLLTIAVMIFWLTWRACWQSVTDWRRNVNTCTDTTDVTRYRYPCCCSWQLADANSAITEWQDETVREENCSGRKCAKALELHKVITIKTSISYTIEIRTKKIKTIWHINVIYFEIDTCQYKCCKCAIRFHRTVYIASEKVRKWKHEIFCRNFDNVLHCHSIPTLNMICFTQILHISAI